MSIQKTDHYVLLSHLLDLWSRGQTLLCHCTIGTMSGRPGNLRTPPLPFWEETAPSNCLHARSPIRRIHGSMLNLKQPGVVFSRLAPRLASRFQASTYPTQTVQSQCKATVKVHGVFPSSRGDCIFTNISTSLSLRETVWPSLRHSCRSELTRQGISLPWDRYSYGRRLPGLRSGLHPIITFRHRAGVTPYTSTVFAECCVLINSRSHRFTAAPSPSARWRPTNGAYLLPKLRYQFAEFLLLSSLKRLRISHPAHLCRFAVRSILTEA